MTAASATMEILVFLLLSLTGIALNGVGWIVLGLWLAIGRRT